MMSDWSIRRARGVRGVTLSLGILSLGALGCGDDLTQPEASTSAHCAVPLALVADHNPEPLALADLREAFLYAAGPIGSALGSSERVDRLKQAMDALGSQSETRNMDLACRLVLAASESLSALEDIPETLPDREAIRLVLLLAAGVVRAGMR